jgi:hypothetical protein
VAVGECDALLRYRIATCVRYTASDKRFASIGVCESPR